MIQIPRWYMSGSLRIPEKANTSRIAIEYKTADQANLLTEKMPWVLMAPSRTVITPFTSGTSQTSSSSTETARPSHTASHSFFIQQSVCMTIQRNDGRHKDGNDRAGTSSPYDGSSNFPPNMVNVMGMSYKLFVFRLQLIILLYWFF
jgi:hypothetical protein